MDRNDNSTSDHGAPKMKPSPGVLTHGTPNKPRSPKAKPKMKLRIMIRKRETAKPSGSRRPSSLRGAKAREAEAASKRIAKRAALVKSVVERIRGTEIGKCFSASRFGADFERSLEEMRSSGSRKFVAQSRSSYYRALVAPYEMWLFLTSGLTEEQGLAAFDALRARQDVDPESGDSPPKLTRRTDPLAIVLRAFIEYLPGKTGSQAVSRDAAALRYLEGRQIMPEAIVTLATKPGEGLEVWRDRHAKRAARKPTAGKTARVIDNPRQAADAFHLTSEGKAVRTRPSPKRKAKAITLTSIDDVGAVRDEVVVLSRGIKVPQVGTYILLVTRRPRSKKLRVLAVERARGEVLKRKSVERLMSRLTGALLSAEDA